jgi:arylsulfatase A-like enzyme
MNFQKTKLFSMLVCVATPGILGAQTEIIKPGREGLTENNFEKPDKLPNLIIILTDQQRADHCGREGFPLDVTPFQDQMAEKGIWFDKAYTPSPVCVPARISMLTGRYPSAHHANSNHNIIDGVFQHDIIEVMKYRGYKTGLIGKNHTYLRPSDLDHFRGIDHIRAFDEDTSPEKTAYGEWLRSTRFHNSETASPFPLEFQHTYRIVEESEKWIQELGDEPFFLWMSFGDPHNPYQVPEPYFNMFPPESLPPVRTNATDLDKKRYAYRKNRELSILAHGDIEAQMPGIRSNYMGMLRMIDDQVKRFIEFLEDNDLMDNTVIVFISDHGDFVGEYGMIRKSPGTSDVLARIPMIWYGNGVKEYSGLSDAHVSIIDIFPTFCEMIGVDIPLGVQGRSLAPILSGNPYPKREFASVYVESGYGGLFFDESDQLDPFEEGAVSRAPSFDENNTWTMSGTGRMIRMGDWKLEMDMLGNGTLYNMKKDPVELNNLYGKRRYRNIQSELTTELLRLALQFENDIPIPRRRYHYKRDIRNYYMTD